VERLDKNLSVFGDRLRGPISRGSLPVSPKKPRDPISGGWEMGEGKKPSGYSTVVNSPEKWKWEFLRRNKGYRKDWIALNSQSKGKLKYEKTLLKKWSVNWDKMFDPEKSYEEIMGLKEYPVGEKKKLSDKQVNERAKDLLDRFIFKKGLESDAVKEVSVFCKENNIVIKDEDLVRFCDPYCLLISVNLKEVNSILSLKKAVFKIIERKANRIGIFSEGKEPKNLKLMDSLANLKERVEKGISPIKLKGKKRIYAGSDFEVVIQVGDLKAQKLTNEAIAKRIYPDQFKEPINENDPDPNPEAAIRKISHHLKRFNDLVNGGYKGITSL
jgi:hypothetical protein